jgi:hypothetical protein
VSIPQRVPLESRVAIFVAAAGFTPKISFEANDYQEAQAMVSCWIRMETPSVSRRRLVSRFGRLSPAAPWHLLHYMDNGKAELVHMREYRPNPMEPSVRRAWPDHSVSARVPLTPTPDDPVFTAAVTLSCYECDEEYRVGLLRRSVRLRHLVRRPSLWVALAITVGLELLLGLGFLPGLIKYGNDDSAPMAFVLFFVFVLIAAFPLYLALGNLHLVRGDTTKVDGSKPSSEEHGWVWTRPTGRTVAYVRGDSHRVHRRKQSDPQQGSPT